LETLYTEDVHFEDPAHALQGRKPLMDYFASLFRNLESCSFKFHQTLMSDTDIFMSWTMFIEHPKLRNGATIRVEGGSLLKTRNGKIYYHRDYFDMGAMIYEHLPLLGRVVKKVKQRLGQ
jgi:ketosteroid isomerase-like protein